MLIKDLVDLIAVIFLMVNEEAHDLIGVVRQIERETGLVQQLFRLLQGQFQGDGEGEDRGPRRMVTGV